MGRFTVHLFLIGANLLYGANYSIAKVALPAYIKPYGFICLRVVGAGLLFLLLHSIYFKEKIQRKDWPRLILCGLFGVALNQTLFFKGLAITTEINAALIMITTPLLVLMLANFILGEKITTPKLIGIVLGISGAATIILMGGSLNFGSSTMLGDFFIFVNAVSYGLYLVLVKPLMRKYSPFTIIKWVFLIGAVFVVPVGFQQVQDIEWSTFTDKVWASLIYVVIGTTFFAYLLNISALRHASPSVVSVYIYSQPLIASIIALGLGTDSFNIPKVVGGLLIIIGVYLVSLYRTPVKG